MGSTSENISASSPEACELARRHMSPVLVFFVPPDKHGEELRRPKYAQRFYCSTCHWWVSCRKSIYPSIPRTCVPLLRHVFHRAWSYFSTAKLGAGSWSDTDHLTPSYYHHHQTDTISRNTQWNSAEDDGVVFEGKLSTRSRWQRTRNTRNAHHVHSFTG